jgi:serine/threonine-protein kinase
VAWLVAGVGLLIAVALAGVLLRHGPDGDGDGGTAAAAPSAPVVPDGAAAPTPVPPPISGDLDLNRPLRRPPCDGRFIVVVGSAIDPVLYRPDVAALLNTHPGASYLLAEDSCPSLRARTAEGDSIYAVYLGPFTRQEEACASRRAVGGDSYVRVLDDGTPADGLVAC